MDSHMSIPRRTIVQCFTAYGTLFTLFGIAHACGSHFLHVIVQLKLLQQKQNKIRTQDTRTYYKSIYRNNYYIENYF